MKLRWLLILCAANASAAVFDVDDRVAEQGTPSELSAIGVIKGTRGIYGTAFLVGDCEALTAKHVAGPVATAIGQRMRFSRPGVAAGGSAGTVIAEGSQDLVSYWFGENHVRDWMLIRLDRCLGRTTLTAELSKMSISWPRSAPTMQSAGFPGPRGWKKGITRDPACRLRMIHLGIYRNDCASLPGDSGGPVFVIEGDGDHRRLKVYAIQVAADHWPGVQPWQVNRGNLAIDASVIAPLIEPYLTRSSQQQARAERKGADRANQIADRSRSGAQVRTR